jgi:hypothetical protein
MAYRVKMAAQIGSFCQNDRLTQWQNPIFRLKNARKNIFGIGTVSALY